MHTFTLEYWQDEGWYVGRLKEVVGVASQGQTLVELEENIRDAYQLMAEMVSATRRGPRRHLPGSPRASPAWEEIAPGVIYAVQAPLP